jgi:hypothetical protein
MKRNTMMMLALVGMTAGLTTVNAEEEAQAQNAAAASAQKAQVVTTGTAQKTTETAATKLSIEEQAFVAKLNDFNRKTFSDKLSAEQRKAIMIAVKNGANADEAVQRMVAAKDLKDSPAVANAERANTATPAAK